MIDKYILFEYDHGGPTNIILSFKFIVYLCYITDRILIIPPPQSIYHYDWGPNGLNESQNNFNNISKTNLIDIINIDSFKKYIKIITFEEFYNIEKSNLNLPINYHKYHNIHTFYKNMLIQGNRLKSRNEKNNRDIYWCNMAKYLENYKNNFDKEKDWVLYALNNFKTIKIKNRKENQNHILFIKKLKKKKNTVIFFPMDINFNTKNYIYPRIFLFAVKFTTNEKIWDKIFLVKYLNKKFYKIVNDIIENYLSNGNYDALHWRYNGFNQKKEYNDDKILSLIEKKVKSDKLYIASDSFEKIFKQRNYDKYKFKIISFKDINKDDKISKKDIPFIEQLICVKSNIFIGTEFSSFSSEILNIRTKKLNNFRKLQNQDNSKNYFI